MYKTEHWHHDFDLDPENQFGFIYYVENIQTGKKYIGKKQYFSYKSNKKHKESNWKKYLSSSKHLKEDIDKYGIDNFYFEILFECKTRGDLTYAEANLQHKNNVLTERNEYGERLWYNASIASIKFIPKPENIDKSKLNTPHNYKSSSIKSIRNRSKYLKETWLKDPKFGSKHSL